MNRLTSIAAALVLALAGCDSGAKKKQALIEANRNRIISLVKPGEPLIAAEQALKSAGFRLTYPQAIDPTGRGEYVQQLVLIHRSLLDPNAADTMRYTIGSDASAHQPYVIINADLSGNIMSVR